MSNDTTPPAPTAAEDLAEAPEHTGAGGRTDETAGAGSAGPAGPEQAVDAKQAMLNAVGGPWGMAASVAPTVVFATAVSFVSLPISIGVALAAALVIAVVQLSRGQTFSSATGGFVGVGVAGGISALTGSANDFFVIGIWAALVVGAVTLVSVLMRRPLTGVVWNAVHGGTHAWREDRPALRAHYAATLAVTVMCAARFGVQEWLYRADATTALAVADTVMGFPLTGVVAVVVVWAFRRSTKRLIGSAAAPAAAQS